MNANTVSVAHDMDLFDGEGVIMSLKSATPYVRTDNIDVCEIKLDEQWPSAVVPQTCVSIYEVIYAQS